MDTPLDVFQSILESVLSDQPLDSSLESQELARQRHFLGIGTADDMYWQIGNSSLDLDLVQARTQAKEDYGMVEFQPGTPSYHADVEQLRCIIPVTNTNLALELAWQQPSPDGTGSGPTPETGDGDLPARWAFLRLRDTRQSAPRGYATADQAIQAVANGQAAGEGMSEARRSPPIPISTSNNKPKTQQEMAEGEGTTPGAYGAAEDFWAGYEDADSDIDGPGNDSKRSIGTATSVPDDESYWDSYDDADAQIEHEPEVTSNQLSDRLSLDNDIESLDLDLGDRTTTTTATAIAQPGNSPRTRSRRSSTVTPSRLGSSSALKNLVQQESTEAASTCDLASQHLPERFKAGATEQGTLSTLPSPDPSPLPTPPSISPGSAARLTSTLRASLLGSENGMNGVNGVNHAQSQSALAGGKEEALARNLSAGLVGDGEDDMSLGSLGQSRDGTRSQSRSSRQDHRAKSGMSSTHELLDSELKSVLEGAWRMYRRAASDVDEDTARSRFAQLAREVAR